MRLKNIAFALLIAALLLTLIASCFWAWVNTKSKVLLILIGVIGFYLLLTVVIVYDLSNKDKW